MKLLSLILLSIIIQHVHAGPQPVVQMHGMGDFAANPAGMVPLARAVSKALGGVYVTNVQIGRGRVVDSINSFLMNMNDQVEAFAHVVRADPQLAQVGGRFEHRYRLALPLPPSGCGTGFNAIGYSQGNLIIRGYIQKYNEPPIKAFLSMHGPMMGVAGIPSCNMNRTACDKVDDLLALGVYNPFVQDHLAQANYFRDPLYLEKYLTNNIFLPDLNNEKASYQYPPSMYSSSKLADIETLVLVKALGDTVISPNESEWFGYFQDGSQSELWRMKEAPWYQADSFGLRTLDEGGKIFFEFTEGDHLQFSTEELLNFVTKYFES